VRREGDVMISRRFDVREELQAQFSHAREGRVIDRSNHHETPCFMIFRHTLASATNIGIVMNAVFENEKCQRKPAFDAHEE
jgi:hypothetical protein